jgi:hypothetical protein
MTGIEYSQGAAGVSETRQAPHRPSNDPRAIRAEIHETRERISQDLDEIGERLNPWYVKEDIKEGIREATIGRVEEMARQVTDRFDDVSHGLTGAIRENPIPAAMAGIGLALLFMNRKGSAVNQARRGASYSLQSEDSSESQPRLDDVVETVRETAREAAERAREAAERAQNVVSRRADTRTLANLFYDSPLAIAAGVAAVGLAVGMAAPVSRTERQLMGRTDTQLAGTTDQTSRDAREWDQQVVPGTIGETGDMGREELGA